ncbi:hypothetical protein BO98_01105 [Candidatus Synechococcus spongiarum LMB bulk10D]|nr:hypothetical protein BO98_01105 [Candidatus Synechococcus spongiarum LMB bulk10D]
MSPWFALPGKLENQIGPTLTKPNEKFLKKPKAFRESVRSISQAVGYSKDGKIIAPKVRQITEFAQNLEDYFEERTRIPSNRVEAKLMCANQAEAVFDDIRQKSDHQCLIPMNKQKGCLVIMIPGN